MAVMFFFGSRLVALFRPVTCDDSRSGGIVEDAAWLAKGRIGRSGVVAKGGCRAYNGPMENAERINERQAGRVYRIGAVSFFNSRPLIYGLAEDRRVTLERAAPAVVGEWLRSGRVDAGLAPSVDYQRSPEPWVILPGAVIASQGEVLTVRVFSRRPMAEIDELACDTDSHTSVVLAQVLWRLRYGRELKVRRLTGPARREEAVLLIGDKVLTECRQRGGPWSGRWSRRRGGPYGGRWGEPWPHELDLGAAWREATGLPFVYAFWSYRPREDDGGEPLAAILTEARRQGEDHIDEVALRYAAQHGFGVEHGRQYLRENLWFRPDEACWEGLERFYSLADEMGYLERRQELRFAGPMAAQRG